MMTLGEPLDVSSRDALRGLLRAAAGHVAWLGQEVGELEDLDSFEAAVLLDMYNSERDRLLNVAKVCEERGIDPAEQVQIQQFAGVLNVAIREFADRVGLTDEQLVAAPDALRQALMTALPEEQEDFMTEDDWEAWERERGDEFARRRAQAEALGMWEVAAGDVQARDRKLRAAGFYDPDPRRWDAFAALEGQRQEAAARLAAERQEQYRRAELIDG